jgi:hypothetical protein
MSLRSLGSAVQSGFEHSFMTGPMTNLISATQNHDPAQMTVALAKLTDASNTAGLLTRIAKVTSEGIKSLTQQS